MKGPSTYDPPGYGEYERLYTIIYKNDKAQFRGDAATIKIYIKDKIILFSDYSIEMKSPRKIVLSDFPSVNDYIIKPITENFINYYLRHLSICHIQTSGEVDLCHILSHDNMIFLEEHPEVIQAIKDYPIEIVMNNIEHSFENYWSDEVKIFMNCAARIFKTYICDEIYYNTPRREKRIVYECQSDLSPDRDFFKKHYRDIIYCCYHLLCVYFLLIRPHFR